MKKKTLQKKIEELEERIRLLEARPMNYIVLSPLPVQYPINVPYIQPYDPNIKPPFEPYITYGPIGTGTFTDSCVSVFKVE